MVNTAKIGVNTVWTRLFSTAFNYQNTVVRYENSGATQGLVLYNTTHGLVIGPSVNASLAGLLDRVDQSASLDLKWQVMKETVALVGYQIELVNFIGNEPIAYNPEPIQGTYYNSDSRDNLSHYGYVGVQHSFSENLSGNIKAGVQYTTYYNDPSASSSLGPYADASLIYTYAAGSYMQLGVMETRNATDTVQVDSSGRITQDQESTVVYGSINHPLTAKLMASAVGHFQYSTYNDGQLNNQSSKFYNLGLNLSYTFNRHFSSEVGYNFDYYRLRFRRKATRATAFTWGSPLLIRA